MPGYRDWYSVKFSTEDTPFEINFDPYEFKPMDFESATTLTIERMCESNPNMWLAFSGGLDSEYIANSLYERGYAFTPIIFRDKDNTESDIALHWCLKRNVKPVLVEINIQDEALIKILSMIAARYRSSSLLSGYNVYLASIAAKAGGALITGTGVITPDPRYPLPMGDRADLVDYDYFIDVIPKHHGSFFMHSPEMLYSIVRSIDPELPTQEFKSQLYRIEFRPKIRNQILLSKSSNKIFRHSVDSRYSFDDLKKILSARLSSTE